MKRILLFIILLSITGCLSTNPTGPGTSTKQIKKQIKYKWSQVDKDMTKEEVARILGIPTDVHDSEDIETWKYEYDIARTYGSVGFHRSDYRVLFFSKPSF
jgi:outer membrane protein assembly factor BamE (lipoprotein component of BamABCDE complex)